MTRPECLTFKSRHDTLSEFCERTVATKHVSRVISACCVRKRKGRKKADAIMSEFDVSVQLKELHTVVSFT